MTRTTPENDRVSPTQRLVRRTQEAYVRAVRQLAEHYHKSPDLITEEELRQYFLYIKNLKHYSRKTSTIAICGIKFFLKRRSAETGPLSGYCARPAKRRLPVILSPEEVRKILGCLRLPRYKVCLTSIYSCGLRLQEGINLRVAHIDSARRMIYVPHGKGAKDRYVPLPQRILALLRQSWVTHRNPLLLFPSPGHGELPLATATKPIQKSSVQDAFHATLKESGNNKRASVHTLRHSWATHLLAAGVNLRLIQSSGWATLRRPPPASIRTSP